MKKIISLGAMPYVLVAIIAAFFLVFAVLPNMPQLSASNISTAVMEAFACCGGGGGGAGGTSCFPAGTKITLADGSEKNIEDVEVGDTVLSYDTETESYIEAEVLELESPMREGYYSINDDMLRVTNEHPLYTKKMDGTVGWAAIDAELALEDTALRPIYELQEGDQIFTKGDGWVAVSSIEYVEGELQTYNLKSVSNSRTFFADGVLAHNKEDNDTDPGPEPAPDPKPAVCHFLDADPFSLPAGGGDVELSWGVSLAESISIDNGVGEIVSSYGSVNVFVEDDTTFTLTATNGVGSDSCQAPVEVAEEAPEPVCTLNIDPTNITLGESTTITWDSENAVEVLLNGEAVSLDGSTTVTPDSAGTQNFTLKAVNADGDSVMCDEYLSVEEPPAPDPVCTLNISPTNITLGESATISWNTDNATAVTLNGQGVSLDGSKVVTPNSAGSKNFTLVAKNADGDTVVCDEDLQVVEPNLPVCKAFTANPNSLPAGGGNVTLSWDTDFADLVSINNGIGTVTKDGSIVVSVADDISYTLTASANNTSDTCTVAIEVAEPVPDPVCTLNIAPDKITLGQSATKSWTTDHAVRATINGTQVALDGSQNVTPNSVGTHTFTLKAFNEDGDSVICKDTLVVEEPPAPDPVCTTDIYPQVITLGENAKLTWETDNAVTVTLNGTNVALDGFKHVSPATTGTKTYTFKAFNEDGDSVICKEMLEVKEPQPDPLKCTLSIDKHQIDRGESATMSWTTDNADTVMIDNGIGTVAADGNMSISPTTNTTYTLTATRGDETVNCSDHIKVEQPEPDPVCQFIKADPDSLPAGGGNVNLSWDTDHGSTVSIDNGLGEVAAEGSTIVSVADDITYTLTVSRDGKSDTCSVPIKVDEPEPKAPACDFLKADPSSLPFDGGTTTLSWNTSHASNVTIDNGIGEVDADGSLDVNVTEDTTFTLTAAKHGMQSDTCTVSVDVGEQNAPICDAFTVRPNTLPFGGGEVTLDWETTNTGDVTIDNGIGAVSADGSATTSVTQDTTFTLTAKNDGLTTTCKAKVDIQPEYSCANNVNFSASDTNVDEGDRITLNWSTTETESVIINPDLGSVSLSGSREVEIENDITYTLTASNGTKTINCPISIEADDDGGGGGGGGTRTPRCEFEVSDDNIRPGEEVTLSWETRYGRDLSIFEGDEDDDLIFETDDDDEVDEGSIRVRPREDTEYTLVVERGRRDRDCTVRVNVDDDVVVTSTRTQGQVAGISLTAVPYTGFEAGPMLTFIFYSILAIWGLFVAYTLVIREDSLMGISLAGTFSNDRVIRDDASTDAEDEVRGESIAAQYVASATAPIQERAHYHTPSAPAAAPAAPAAEPEAPARATTQGANVPSNLPTGDYERVVGYAAAAQKQPAQSPAPLEQADNTPSGDLKQIEDRAHEKKVLLSSDAMQHLINTCPREISRLVYLDMIIAEARISYPAEDGWIVLNLDRMREVCAKRNEALAARETGSQETETVAQTASAHASQQQPVDAPATQQQSADAPSVQTENVAKSGASSLAEAMVTGNIGAAYQMIGNRPMFALADAAADLDNVYRKRKGEQVNISDMLERETADLDLAKLEKAINALTGAIDGTYTDEAAAVKMAIMKATKELNA